jgi:hypothetical protein
LRHTILSRLAVYTHFQELLESIRKRIPVRTRSIDTKAFECISGLRPKERPLYFVPAGSWCETADAILDCCSKDQVAHAVSKDDLIPNDLVALLLTNERELAEALLYLGVVPTSADSFLTDEPPLAALRRMLMNIAPIGRELLNWLADIRLVLFVLSCSVQEDTDFFLVLGFFCSTQLHGILTT